MQNEIPDDSSEAPGSEPGAAPGGASAADAASDPKSAGTEAAAEPSQAASSSEVDQEPAAPDAVTTPIEKRAAASPNADARDVARTRALFTRSAASTGDDEDRFRFARWTKPLSVAVFGLSSESEAAMLSGFQEAAEVAGCGVAAEDPELGANVLIFACEGWSDLHAVPNLSRLAPNLEQLTRMLAAAGANQYRMFTFAPDGGIRLCVVFLKFDEALTQISGAALALGQAIQCLLLWSDDAFADESPVALRRGGKPVVRSRFVRLLKAAYHDESPAYSEDPALAEALTKRMDALRAAEPERRRGARAAAERTAADEAESEGGSSEEAAPGEAASQEGGVVGPGAEAEPVAANGAGPETPASAAPEPKPEQPETAAPDPLGGDPRPAAPDAFDDRDPSA